MNLGLLNSSKVSAPDVPNDYLLREPLLNEINSGLEKENILIQSPAGFGKSTLVAAYLTHYNINAAWLSLDENDNEVERLISYIAFGFRKTGKALQDTESSLSSTSFVDSTDLISTFKKEIENLQTETLFVIDDFHLVTNETCQDLILVFLKSKNVKTIFISRLELPVVNWHDYNTIHFIGIDKLTFSKEEFYAYFDSMDQLKPSIELYQEGWITGIKLSAQPSNGLTSAKSVVAKAIKNFSDPDIIYTLSLLEWFDEALCIALFDRDDIIEELTVSPLIISKNKSSHYRFHHLIRDIASSLFDLEHSSNVSASLIKAVEYFLTIQDNSSAFDLSIKIRNELLTQRSFLALRIDHFNSFQLRNLVPISEKLNRVFHEDKAEKTLTSAWVDIVRGDTLKMISRLNELDKEALPSNLIGEYYALLTYRSYVMGDHKAVINQADLAFSHSIENLYAFGFLYIFKIGSLQSLGKIAEAYEFAIHELERVESRYLKCQILLVLCYISRFECKQEEVKRYAESLLFLSKEIENQEGIANASAFISEYYYLRGNSIEGLKHSKRAFELKDRTIGVIKMSIIWNHARILENLGKVDSAKDLIEQELVKSISEGNHFLQSYFEGMLLHLALLSGKDQASLSADHIVNIDPNLPISESYSPVITVLLLKSINEPNSIYDFLLKVKENLKRNQNLRPLAEVHIIESILLMKAGKPKEAYNTLDLAICEMPNDNFKQLFLEYCRIAPALKSYFDSSNIPVDHGLASLELLSNRETQILELFKERLSDKEIAKKLGISYSTVKRHNANIFKKLVVNTKREALERLQIM